jgi:hypothetical protein
LQLSSPDAIPTPVSAGGLLFVTSGFRGNALKAVRLAGARGDLTGTPAVVWSHDRNTPYVPSPLLYDGVLYILKHNTGILSRRALASSSAAGRRAAPGQWTCCAGSASRVLNTGGPAVQVTRSGGYAARVLVEGSLAS